ncbi:glycoside hydrolase family 28 protein [Flavobacterium sp. ARAG 55.4]|uniref:glycoside hydrolase family 28 protein n=1 Tax=Flavobacterium sp. ARAG 55.4 TaxID=3451357 RepID=UPI003F45C055
MKKASLILLVLFSFLCIHAQSNKTVYNVYDFGAKGDGITNDQTAIQKAIDACKEKGGTVVLEKGTFLTGQIVLVNNLTLQIEPSATLLGIKSDDEKDYPHHLIDTKYPNRMLEDCQRRLIYGNKVRNVTITGGGIINGQGDYEPWMHVKEIGTEKDRPSILAFVGSNNITVSNLTLIKPACWTQVYIESENINIQKIKVNTGQLTPNRDGIDIVDCHNVLIEDSYIESEDDGICFKSGSEYGCKDIIVRRCILDKLNVKAGNCFKLGTDGLGSFMNFDVSELILKNAYQNSAFCIESMDGAVIDNLNFRDCQITNCGQAIFILLADRRRTVPERKTRIGAISNISFKNINGTDFTQQYPSLITGIKGHNIQNVTFENLNFELKGGIQTTNQTVMEYDGKYPEGSYFGNTNAFGFFIRHADTITFTNCNITTKSEDKRPWLVQEDTHKVEIN